MAEVSTSDLICIEFFKKKINNNMRNLAKFLIVISALYLMSCDTNSLQEIQGVVTNPTYSEHIGPVFNSKCVGCHSSGNQYPDLQNYSEVQDAVMNGSVICRIENQCGDIMPPEGALPQQTIDMIVLWQSNGYPN